MYISKYAMQVVFGVTSLLLCAAQEPDKIIESAASVGVSLDQVLDKVYAQYSDKKFNSMDVWYIEDSTKFPPVKFHYVLDGEDRLREQYEENGTIYVLKFVNGRTTIYTPSNTTATIISGKEPLQDSCNYLMSLGFPISDEQRAASSSFFPEALRNESLGWKLDNNYWLVDEN